MMKSSCACLNTDGQTAVSHCDFFSYSAELHSTLKKVSESKVEHLINLIRCTSERHGLIAVCGNGGSSSTSDHFVCDLTGRSTEQGIPPIRAISLAANPAVFSAAANDLGYEQSYSSQVRTMLRPNDLLLCISFSGKSENLIRAADAARKMGVRVAALTGPGGGELANEELAEVVVEVDSDNIRIVEDAHLAICHYLSQQLLTAGP